MKIARHHCNSKKTGRNFLDNDSKERRVSTKNEQTYEEQVKKNIINNIQHKIRKLGLTTKDTLVPTI
jgi:hypothetical protein